MTEPDQQGGGTPPRKTGDKDSGTERKRHGTVALVFACALPLAVLILPTVPALTVAVPVLGAGALVAAVLARRAARTSGGSAPGTSTALLVGVIGLVVSLVAVPFWHSLGTYENCVSSALTVQDRHNCQQSLDRSISSQVPFSHISTIMDGSG